MQKIHLINGAQSGKGTFGFAACTVGAKASEGGRTAAHMGNVARFQHKNPACCVLLSGYAMRPIHWEVPNLMRVKITLACSECKQRNYDTKKNKKNDPDRLELKKFCRFCRKHTLHKETK